MSDEFSRIAKYFAPLAGEEGRGLTDDAAVLAPPPGRELVLTVDQMLEDVHFLPGDDPALIARKLLRRNLSDLAAMGAVPLGYLLTIALPDGVGEDWLAGFSQGLARDQKIFNIKLFGGDSSSSRGKISLSATLIGHVAPGAALSRNGARAGDGIWVSGTIGDAALGLQARLGRLADPSGFLTARSLLPEPRVGLALAGVVSAAIDVSDGLVQDLGHMCKGAGLSAVIRAGLVPVSAAAAAASGEAALETRLTGGDDYELLLAVPPGQGEALKAACGDLPVTKIGMFQAGAGVHVLNDAGAMMQFTRPGWRHF
ncbi:thiamine-monophosphate kinase [Acidocella aquatica]|uniref:Thiamine-monophosphate kinase n=1 Tax=Acidocella aquatica TaxID=1922313 RepID=A0ABQ6A7V6_9PROT|nr:thiamine-phosphate kinase [Acidocella aquatica]GLR66288.1 thiamine-monophosphate kinase [Acidocella aquatica]